MLSVALCTYNGEKYVEEQILSIFRQTMPVDEIVVCDDGSSDATLDILHRLVGPHTNLRIVCNEKSLGVVENFKKAASLCTGDIIFFADQDDRWHADKVATMVDYLDKHPEIEVVFTDARIIDSTGSHEPAYGNLFQMTFQKEERRMFNAGLELESFLARNHATGATMAVRRIFLEETDPFQLCTDQILHDYALALRAAEMGVLGVLYEPLIDYRRHDSGQTVFEIPKDGKASKWHTYYNYLREFWPNGDIAEIKSLITANHAAERIDFIATRNSNLHKLSSPLRIPFSLKQYRNLYGSYWHKIMRYDISQCIRYTFLRLTHRLPEK